MSDEVTHVPTGRSSKWEGLDFDQYQIKGGYLRGFHAIYKLRGYEHMTIQSARIGYRASIDGVPLPTKFQKWETAARALKERLASPSPTIEE